MRVYLGSLVARPDGRQFLISVLDDDTVTSATRPTADRSEPWSPPVSIGEVVTR